MNYAKECLSAYETSSVNIGLSISMRKTRLYLGLHESNACPPPTALKETPGNFVHTTLLSLYRTAAFLKVNAQSQADTFRIVDKRATNLV